MSSAATKSIFADADALDDVLQLAERLVVAYDRSCAIVGSGADRATLECFRDDHLYGLLQLRGGGSGAGTTDAAPQGLSAASLRGRPAQVPLLSRLDALSTLWILENRLVESLAEAPADEAEPELRDLSQMMMERARRHFAWLAVRVFEERLAVPLC